MLRILLAVAVFALSVFCLVEAISTPAERVRNLPKAAWVLLVLFFPFVGSVAWLVAGRPEGAGPRQRSAPAAYPEYDRPGRFAAADPETDEEFLRRVRERAEEQRRRHEQSKKAEPDPDEPPATT